MYDQSADALEYGRNLVVNANARLLNVMFDLVCGELQRGLGENEQAISAFLAGYSLGMMNAIIMLAPSQPQQFSPPMLTPSVLADR